MAQDETAIQRYFTTSKVTTATNTELCLCFHNCLKDTQDETAVQQKLHEGWMDGQMEGWMGF